MSTRKQILPYSSQRRSILENDGYLSPDQENALQLVLGGKSIFLTGAAGTGKSFLTRVIIDRLEQEKRNVLVAASTGVASSIVKGVTLHSLLRFKPIEEQDIQSTLESRYDLDIIKNYWDKNNSKMNPFHRNKNNSKVNPFLFIKDDNTHTQSYTFIEKDPLLSSFTFQQEQEQESTNDTLIKKDSEYYKRRNLFSRDVETWSSIDVLVIDEISMVSKNLFTALDLVARVTRGYKKNELVSLPFGGIQMILVGDFYQLPPVNADFSFESPSWQGIEPVFLEKQHRQIENDDLITILGLIRENVFEDPYFFRQDIDFIMERLGSRIRMKKQNGLVTLVGTNDEADEENKRCQVNLQRICQKNEKPYTEIIFQRIEEHVSSSKSKRKIVNTLVLSNGTQVMCTRNIHFNDGTQIHNGMIGIVYAFAENETSVLFQNKEYETIAKNVSKEWKMNTPMIPVVLFKGLTRPVMIPGVETDEYERKGTRTVLKTISIELPLIPAWAITIHKSQGLTFDQVQINLTRTFTENQIYVALSRAKRLEDIFITGILPPPNKSSWRIDRRVVNWTKAQKEQKERRREEEIQRYLALQSL